MNLHVDRKTIQLSAESRRLWDDVRVWMMNCLVVEAAWQPKTHAEREQARRGRDQILAAFIEAW
jgi:hypothetical protein